MRARVVEREEPEAAAQVEHAPARGQVLADLVEEPLAQDPEAPPAVRAHDRIVVGADDATNRFASHRSGIRGRSTASGNESSSARASSGNAASRRSRARASSPRGPPPRPGGRAARPAMSSARSARMRGSSDVVEEVEVVDEARGLPQTRDAAARGCRPAVVSITCTVAPGGTSGPRSRVRASTRRAFSAIHGASSASTPLAPSTITSERPDRERDGRARAPEQIEDAGPAGPRATRRGRGGQRAEEQRRADRAGTPSPCPGATKWASP